MSSSDDSDDIRLNASQLRKYLGPRALNKQNARIPSGRLASALSGQHAGGESRGEDSRGADGLTSRLVSSRAATGAGGSQLPPTSSLRGRRNSLGKLSPVTSQPRSTPRANSSSSSSDDDDDFGRIKLNSALLAQALQQRKSLASQVNSVTSLRVIHSVASSGNRAANSDEASSATVQSRRGELSAQRSSAMDRQAARESSPVRSPQHAPARTLSTGLGYDLPDHRLQPGPRSQRIGLTTSVEPATSMSSSSRPLPQPQLPLHASSQLHPRSHTSGAGSGHVDNSDFHSIVGGRTPGHDEQQGPRHAPLATMLVPLKTTEAAGSESNTSRPPWRDPGEPTASELADLAAGGLSVTSQLPEASGSVVKHSSSTQNVNGDSRGLSRPVLLGGPGGSSPLRSRFTDTSSDEQPEKPLRPRLSADAGESRAAAAAAPAGSPTADRLGAPACWSGASTTGGSGASFPYLQQRGEAAAAFSPMKAAMPAPADHPASPQQQLLQKLLSPGGSGSVVRRQPIAVAADVLSMLAAPADPEEEEGSHASALGTGRGLREGSLTSSPCLSVASGQTPRRLSVEGVVRAALGFTDDESWSDDSPPASPSRLGRDPPAPLRDAAASSSSSSSAAAPAATDARAPPLVHIGGSATVSGMVSKPGEEMPGGSSASWLQARVLALGRTGSAASNDVQQDGRSAIAPQESPKPQEASAKTEEQQPGGSTAGWLKALLSPIKWTRQSPGGPSTAAGAAAAAPLAATVVGQAGGEARGPTPPADTAAAAPQSPLRRRVSFDEPEKRDAQPRLRPSFTNPGPISGLHLLNLGQGTAAPSSGSAAASAGLHPTAYPPPPPEAAAPTAAVSVLDGVLAADASDEEGGGWSAPGRLSITTVALDMGSQPAASADAGPAGKPNSEPATSTFSFPVRGNDDDQRQRHASPANKRPESLPAWQAPAAVPAARSPRSPSPTRPATTAPLPLAPAAAAASPGHQVDLMKFSGGGTGGGGVGVGLQMLLPVTEWSRLWSGTVLGRTVPSPPDSPARSISPAGARPLATPGPQLSAAGSTAGSLDRQVRYGSPSGVHGRVPGGSGLRSSSAGQQTDPWVTTLADRRSKGGGGGSVKGSPSHRVRSVSPSARAARLGTATAGADPAAASGGTAAFMAAAPRSPPGSPVRRPGSSAGRAWPAGRASPPKSPLRPPSPPLDLGSNGGSKQGARAASTSPRTSEPGSSGGGRYTTAARLGYADLAQRRREGGRYSRSGSPGPPSPPARPKPVATAAALVTAVPPPGGKQQWQRSPGPAQTQVKAQQGSRERRAAGQQDLPLGSLQQPSFSFFVADAGLRSRQEHERRSPTTGGAHGRKQEHERRSPTSAGFGSGLSRQGELAGHYPGGHATLRGGAAARPGSPAAPPGSGPTRGGGAGGRYSSPSSPRRLGLEALALSGGAKGRRPDAFSCDGGGGSSGGSRSRSPAHNSMGLSEVTRATQQLKDLSKQFRSVGAGGGGGRGGGDAGPGSSGWLAAGASPSRSPVAGAAQPAPSPSLRLPPSPSIDMEDAVLLSELADSRFRRLAGAARPTTSPALQLGPSNASFDAKDAALLRQLADSRSRLFTGAAGHTTSSFRSVPGPSPSIDAEDAFLLHQIAQSHLQPFTGASQPTTSPALPLGPSNGSIDAEDAALLRQLADIQRDVERLPALAPAARPATASAARQRLHGPFPGRDSGLDSAAPELRPWTAQQQSILGPRRRFSWSSAAGTNTAAAVAAAAAAGLPSLSSTLRRMSRPGTASADARAARPRATSPPPRVAEMAVAMAVAASSVAARYFSGGGDSAAAGLQTVLPALHSRPPAPRIEPLALPQRRRSMSSPGSPRLPAVAAETRREQQLRQLQQQLLQQREAELSRPVGAWAVLSGPVEAPTARAAGHGTAAGASSARDYARHYAFYVGAEVPADGRSRSTPHSYSDARRGDRHGRYGTRASRGGATVAAVSLAGSVADDGRSSRSVSAGGSLCIYTARSPSRTGQHARLGQGAFRASGGGGGAIAAAAAITALTGGSTVRLRSRSAGSGGGSGRGGGSQRRQGRYGAAAAAGASTGHSAGSAAMLSITLPRALSVLDLTAVTRGLRRSVSQAGDRPSTPTSPVASASVVRTLWMSPAAVPTPKASAPASAALTGALFQHPNWHEQRQPSTPGVAKLPAFSAAFPAPHHDDPWDTQHYAVTFAAAPSPVTGLMQGATRAALAASSPSPSPSSLSPRPRSGSRSPPGARPASPPASSLRVPPARAPRAEASRAAAATAGAAGGSGRYFTSASSSSARQGTSPARSRTTPTASSGGAPPDRAQRASPARQTRPAHGPSPNASLPATAAAAAAGLHPSLTSKPTPSSTSGSRRQQQQQASPRLESYLTRPLAGPANTQSTAETQHQAQSQARTRTLAALLTLSTPHPTPVAASEWGSASGSRRASATAMDGPASSGASNGGHRPQGLDLVLQGLSGGPNTAARAELSHALAARKMPQAASAGGSRSAGGGGGSSAAAAGTAATQGAAAAAAAGRRTLSLLTTADVLPYSAEPAAARLNLAAAAMSAGSAAPSASPGAQATGSYLQRPLR